MFYHFFVLRASSVRKKYYLCRRFMAGIYVHIPFCKSRCVYCDFYSTTREQEAERYIQALCREIAGRKGELSHTRVRTIYIGGGTPSLLSTEQLCKILACIHEHYTVEPDAEVTLEMNPEDLVDGVQLRGINRISLGIQTFDDELLCLLRRRHTAARAVEAVRHLQAAGFDNISIDLIYGLPGQTMEQWEHDLSVAFSLGVQHLSAYALSYEEGTVLSRWRREGKVREASDELSVEMYGRLCQRAKESGFQHYEISNFALPGHHSRHNSSYWTGDAYLGFGPGAHSFDGDRTRRANNPDLQHYLLTPYFPPHTDEHLSDSDLYDETVMCGLRTSHGIDLETLALRFGKSYHDYLLRMAQSHLQAGRLVLDGGRLRLTQKALMVSDDIMSDLMA